MASRPRVPHHERGLHEPVSLYLPIKLNQTGSSSRLAFFKAQVDEGTITEAATCVNIKVSDAHLVFDFQHERQAIIQNGEITTLTQDDDEVFHFSVRLLFD